MRILITADLHFTPHWFEWLVTQAESGNWDVICLGGDLLDMFNKDPRQEIQVDVWLSRIAQSKTPVCVCSGNHDTFAADGYEINQVVPYPRAGQITAESLDGMTFLVKNELLVTSCPWNFSDWEKLEAISHTRKGKPWIILTHTPPASHAALLRRPLDGGMPTKWTDDLMPTYVFSGHIHDLPQLVPFAKRIVGGWSLNAGQISNRCSIPNHIVLNTNQKTAVWYHGDPAKDKMNSTSVALR